MLEGQSGAFPMLFPWGKRPNPWCVLLEQQLCSATAKTCFPDRLHLSGVVFPLSQALLWPQHPISLCGIPHSSPCPQLSSGRGGKSGQSTSPSSAPRGESKKGHDVTGESSAAFIHRIMNKRISIVNERISMVCHNSPSSELNCDRR